MGRPAFSTTAKIYIDASEQTAISAAPSKSLGTGC